MVDIGFVFDFVRLFDSYTAKKKVEGDVDGIL